MTTNNNVIAIPEIYMDVLASTPGLHCLVLSHLWLPENSTAQVEQHEVQDLDGKPIQVRQVTDTCSQYLLVSDCPFRVRYNVTGHLWLSTTKTPVIDKYHRFGNAMNSIPKKESKDYSNIRLHMANCDVEDN